MNLKIKYRSVSELVPYARNARMHDAKNVGEIAQSIQRYGFLDPISIDASGTIVWGHGRLLAAELLNMQSVPTITLPDTLTPEEVKALRLAHNKLAEKSGWDDELLRAELEDLQKLDFDLSDTGFDESEVNNLFRDFERDLAAAETPPRREMPNITIGEEEKDADIAEEEEPETDEDAPLALAPEPKSSDDAYSQFSIVMQHENKVWFLDLLNKVRNAKGLDKLEDALVEIGRAYERNE